MIVKQEDIPAARQTESFIVLVDGVCEKMIKAQLLWIQPK